MKCGTNMPALSSKGIQTASRRPPRAVQEMGERRLYKKQDQNVKLLFIPQIVIKENESRYSLCIFYMFMLYLNIDDIVTHIAGSALLVTWIWEESQALDHK